MFFLILEISRYVSLFRGAGESRLVEWAPDDAFYYLILGRNFALLHRWTFDGIEPATGFHLLWGYTIALIYRLAPNISFEQIFRVLFFAGSLLVAASLSITSVVVVRLFGVFAALAPVAVFCTSMAMQQPNFLMESSLVILFSSLAVYIVTSKQRSSTGVALASAFGVGTLGMLSRSDFGLLPFVLWIACLAMDKGIRTPRVKLASGLFAGSVFGFILVVVHTYMVSGHLIQSSARVKQHWAMLDGNSTIMSAWFSLSPLVDSSPRSPVETGVLFIAIALLLLVAIAVAAWSRQKGRFTITPAVVMGAVVLGYVAFYRYGGNVQPWYLANYIVPYSVLAAGPFTVPGRVWKIISIVALAVWIWKAPVIRKSWIPTWPQQTGFYRAGVYLRDHPELKPVGAWNAGIQSYVAGGGVINLDGLVNQDVVPHVLSNSLTSYLADRHVYRVLDDAIMWNSPITRVHGGYAGDILTRCIQSTETVWQATNPQWIGDHMMLSLLDGECLRRSESLRTKP
jgi:hypothetical protein